MRLPMDSAPATATKQGIRGDGDPDLIVTILWSLYTLGIRLGKLVGVHPVTQVSKSSASLKAWGGSRPSGHSRRPGAGDQTTGSVPAVSAAAKTARHCDRVLVEVWLVPRLRSARPGAGRTCTGSPPGVS